MKETNTLILDDNLFIQRLLEFWKEYDGGILHRKLYARFTEVWHWFWDEYRINKNEFNKMFLNIMVKHRHWICLHGAPTGSFNKKTWLEVPNDYGLWSLDERYQPNIITELMDC